MNVNVSVDILSLIPVGRENAVTRKQLADQTGLNDRTVRELIEKARWTTAVINLQDGHGYYQPDASDLGEIQDAKAYRRLMISRIASELVAVRTLDAFIRSAI